MTKELTRVKMVYITGQPKGVILGSYGKYVNGYFQYADWYRIRLDNGLLLKDVEPEEFQVLAPTKTPNKSPLKRGGRDD